MATFGERIANFFGGTDTDTREGLHGLFVTELKNIYYAERQAIDALGTQADAATTDEVRNALLQHQEETRGQVMRLEQVFQSLGLDADEGACAAIDGLADDAETIISATESDSLTRDAGLIIAAQKVEHHEIASYGSVVTLARVMGHTEVARLLQQTLEEEKNTDRKLTQLAESFINDRASDESGDMGSDNMNQNSFNDSTVNADGTRYADRSSTGQSTYQSGQSYSGTQTGSNDATTGGTLGI
ncbi:ferritin-like domain-containing protein [Spirosoma utsteinense]|uniref:Ferritin-like metal-binding protein YciE n=1 Tax=Spirosoma utsteinense TaxID=2585773 RepID=A0ABR6W9L9_9BACT|nr:ferritin-like domain-containing protein [Spirosoma utsteinense]MBC3783977.1 ferritin-like metal-binding protein YciE [Spirosoma utsteinense]MBC3792612.1 ferritin-like metal-binding protein YciE [Spirosoma utsteinense]